MKVQVPYTCPVIVTVDTETGTVERVSVLDTEAQRDEDAAVTDARYASVVDAGVETIAVAIATAEEGDWPAWDFGI